MWPKRIDNVPPRSLRGVLRGDAATFSGGNLRSRLLGWILGERDGLPRHLYTVVDIASLPENARPKVIASLKSIGAKPLLDGPRYAAVKDYGPMLASHPGGNVEAMLDAFGECDSDIVSAWLVSKLDAEALAAHLRPAIFAQGPDRARYLLRWYDPLITPVLFRLADPAWVKWFLGPISAWWYPVDTPQQETWSRFAGGSGHAAEPPPGPLVFSEELWEALVSDPLPYQILSYAGESMPSAFESSCYGVRAAKIESMLDVARRQGLKEDEDLTTYVLSLLEVPSRAQEARWQTAIRQAAAGQAPLTAYYSG
ncbi:MAG: DUF4123 domain-containing protein [Azoarcus sp.]|jgi:hypothetical protein|nr:DUF4123 domain-containing protein [Azoarcus sp.]